MVGAYADQGAGHDLLASAPPAVVVELACASIQEGDAGAVGDGGGHRLAAAALVRGDTEPALGHGRSIPWGVSGGQRLACLPP